MREKKEARQPASKTGNTIKVKRKCTKRVRINKPVLERKWVEPLEVIVYPNTPQT